MERNELIEQNLNLVHSCAHRFRGKGVEYDELYSAGCVGLVKAADKFDPSLGYRFSTYAVPVILGEIRQLFRDGGTVKLSRSLKELSMKAKAVCERYQNEHGEDIPISRLSSELGVDEYTAAQALNASLSVLSLSGDNDEGGIDIPVPSAEESLTDRLSLRQAIATLSESDRGLITMRYFKHKTQSETAKALGTTQVQISRREKKILLRMRAMLI